MTKIIWSGKGATVSLRHASVVRNSRASVTCDLSIEQWGRDSDSFTCFRLDLNCNPITVASRLRLRKKLNVLSLDDDGFDQAFIKFAFSQQFHVHLWNRPSSNEISEVRTQEIGSIDGPF